MLPVTVTTVQTPVPPAGDFGAVVNGQTMTLPQCVVDCTGVEIQTAEEFVSIMLAIPSCFKQGLGWTMPEIEKAANKLVVQLEGLVDFELMLSNYQPRAKESPETSNPKDLTPQ